MAAAMNRAGNYSFINEIDPFQNNLDSILATNPCKNFNLIDIAFNNIAKIIKLRNIMRYKNVDPRFFIKKNVSNPFSLKISFKLLVFSSTSSFL